MDWLTYEVTKEDEGLTVERILREKLAVSGRMLQRLTRSKGIRLNGRAPYLKRTVKAGDRLAVRIGERRATAGDRLAVRIGERRETAGKPAAVTGAELPDPSGWILYEDDLFLVVNKPAGLLVHPVRPGQSGTFQDVLAVWLQRRGEAAAPHPVHRLDRDTSGALLIAKNSYAHQLADRVLRVGGVEREYLALLTGRIEQERGIIDAPIGRVPGHPLKRRVSELGESARTRYETLARDEASTLVRVWLETGRTHQIRVHFAHLGHPLAGDTLYGKERLGWRRQALHAVRLSYSHPLDRRTVAVTAPLPEDLAREVENRYGLSTLSE